MASSIIVTHRNGELSSPDAWDAQNGLSSVLAGSPDVSELAGGTTLESSLSDVSAGISLNSGGVGIVLPLKNYR
jgi:hypothetical protein